MNTVCGYYPHIIVANSDPCILAKVLFNRRCPFNVYFDKICILIKWFMMRCLLKRDTLLSEVLYKAETTVYQTGSSFHDN